MNKLLSKIRTKKGIKYGYCTLNKKEVQIFNGNDRSMAVMIDNHSGAWPQANLSKAYIVYEIMSYCSIKHKFSQEK